MANEAIQLIKIGEALPFTVSTDLTVEKGALLKFIDSLTVSGNAFSWTVSAACAGIAKSEHIAGTGTKIDVWRSGWFRMKLSGACGYGNPVAMAASANYVYDMVLANISGAHLSRVGIALESVAASSDGTVAVELNPTMMYVYRA